MRSTLYGTSNTDDRSAANRSAGAIRFDREPIVNSPREGTGLLSTALSAVHDDEGEAILIRPYRETAFELLLEMYDAIKTSTMALPPADLNDRKKWLRRLTADGWNMIATCNGDVIGHVAVVPTDATKPEFVIFVDPTYRNRGIGMELLEHASLTLANGITTTCSLTSRGTDSGRSSSTRRSNSTSPART